MERTPAFNIFFHIAVLSAISAPFHWARIFFLTISSTSWNISTHSRTRRKRENVELKIRNYHRACSESFLLDTFRAKCDVESPLKVLCCAKWTKERFHKHYISLGCTRKYHRKLKYKRRKKTAFTSWSHWKKAYLSWDDDVYILHLCNPRFSTSYILVHLFVSYVCKDSPRKR